MKKQIVRACGTCGELQIPNKEKSTENWNVFDNVPCKCGGKFTFMNETARQEIKANYGSSIS